MSRRVGNRAIIEDEEPRHCDDCGKFAELRPYGKNGACICVKCGMKDSEHTIKMMGIILFGDKAEGDI